MDIDFFAGFCLFLAFLVGFILAFVWHWQLKRASLSVVKAQAGEKGRKAQAEQESDMMALIAEAVAGFKAAKENNEDMKTAAVRILPALAASHPISAMKLGKKLFAAIGGKGGGLEGLEGLF